MEHPTTPDGRYVVRGRLWRYANPALPAAERDRLVSALMAARRAVGRARRAGDVAALAAARASVDVAKRGLGERGPVWWADGAPDYTRRLARTTPYAAWFAAPAAAPHAYSGARRLSLVDLTGGPHGLRSRSPLSRHLDDGPARVWETPAEHRPIDATTVRTRAFAWLATRVIPDTELPPEDRAERTHPARHRMGKADPATALMTWCGSASTGRRLARSAGAPPVYSPVTRSRCGTAGAAALPPPHQTRHTDGRRMSRTLPLAREAIVAAIQRDTPGPDLPRLVAVLDALIAWSVARPRLLAFRVPERRKDVVSFERVGSKAVFWSAQVTRGTGPRLEIHIPAGQSLSAEDRATVMETLNAHSRQVLVEGDRLRIGFGALKNAAAQAAVLTMMAHLLADRDEPAAPAAPPAASRAE